MDPRVIGLIVGGLLPAIFYGVGSIFTKASTKAGIGVAPYLIIIGCTIALTGGALWLVSADRAVSWRSGLYAAGFGFAWTIATGCVAAALSVYGAPISKLVPLYNMNTLIAVILGLWIFAEWQEARASQLLIGAALIIAGGIFVTRA